MKTILVAEDNAVNRELMKEILEAANYNVLEAVDGADALAMLTKCQPNVILLDIQMPVMDGRETIRRIRDNPDWRHLPVIACTAFAMRGEREEIMRLGFNGYLAKPISLPDLLFAIRQAD